MASILILGAYGFIGAAITRACRADGHAVSVLGRDPRLLARLNADRVNACDLRRMTSPGHWATPLQGIDVVVNAAGALQDGGRDDVALVQRDAILAMADAAGAAGVQRIVQISAVGARQDAPTAFLRTKAQADEELLCGEVEAVVLRPGLVLGRTVYGGTVLLRMLAAFPVVQPIAMADAAVQTVDVADVVDAVRAAVRGDVPARRAYDLVSDEVITLGELVAAVRGWLGFPVAAFTVAMPPPITWLVRRTADALGHLGWRSPLRSTSLRVLQRGVTGDGAPWREAGMAACRTSRDSLLVAPATLQDRVHARMALAFPVLMAVLAGFWLLSAAIGLVSAEQASRVLLERGFSQPAAVLCVALGSAADLAVGIAVLLRPVARAALLGMLALSLGYLGAGTLFTPDLWGDPLGPLLKIFPAMALAGVTLALLEHR